MVLNIIDDIVNGLENIFTDLENFVATNFSNPILWILIISVLLVIVACAYNTLSK